MGAGGGGGGAGAEPAAAERARVTAGILMVREVGGGKW